MSCNVSQKEYSPATEVKDSVLTVFVSRNDSNGSYMRALSSYIAMMCCLLDPRAKVHPVVDKGDVCNRKHILIQSIALI